MLNIEQAFERVRGCGGFDRVDNPLHLRPDICAFLLLDKLVPGTREMTTPGEEREILLGTDCGKLSAVATLDDIRVLACCGVHYDKYNDCLVLGGVR